MWAWIHNPPPQSNIEQLMCCHTHQFELQAAGIHAGSQSYGFGHAQGQDVEERWKIMSQMAGTLPIRMVS